MFSNVVETTKGAERSVKTTFNIKLNGYIIPEVVQKSLVSVSKFNEKSKRIFSMEVIENEEFFEGTNDGGRIVTTNVSNQEAKKRTTTIS